MAQIPSTIPTQQPTTVPCGWTPLLRVRLSVRLASAVGLASLAGVALTTNLRGAVLACGPLLIGWGG